MDTGSLMGAIPLRGDLDRDLRLRGGGYRSGGRASMVGRSGLIGEEGEVSLE